MSKKKTTTLRLYLFHMHQNTREKTQFLEKSKMTGKLC